VLNLDRANTGQGPGFLLPSLQDRLRDIVPPSPPLLGGMGRAHLIAAIVEQLARQQRVRVLPHSCSALGVLGKQQLDTIPNLLIDDRIMQAFVNLALVGQPPEVNRIRQDLVEMPTADEAGARDLAISITPDREPDVLLVEDGLESHDAANLKISAKKIAHEGGMLVDRMQRPILDYPSGTTPPIQMPFFLEAAILSRIRSPVTSRSNWAKDSSTLRVNRPMLVVVLNAWVTETNDT
jgi:hypothetical protein